MLKRFANRPFHWEFISRIEKFNDSIDNQNQKIIQQKKSPYFHEAIFRNSFVLYSYYFFFFLLSFMNCSIANDIEGTCG
jgi:hypothetical protein